jgi:hypothetical protein
VFDLECEPLRCAEDPEGEACGECLFCARSAWLLIRSFCSCVLFNCCEPLLVVSLEVVPCDGEFCM